MLLHYHYPGDGVHELGNAFSRPEQVAPAPGGASAASGHVPLGLLDRLAPGATLATLLREPVARTLSQHRYLAAGRGRGFVPPSRPARVTGISLAECLEAGYVLDNVQTRMLCGADSPYDPLPADAFERALANLQRFVYLGVTERFEEFLALVTLGMGWPTTAPPHVREGAAAIEPGPEDVHLASAANELDRQLYARASELAADAAARAGERLVEEVEIMQAAVNGDRSDPGLLPREARVELARMERDLVLAQDALRQHKRKLERMRAKRKRIQ